LICYHVKSRANLICRIEVAFHSCIEYNVSVIDLRKSWDKIALRYVRHYGISTEKVHYGPLCPGENGLNLLGDISGKKVLDLGCGCGQNSIALTRLGASVTGVDFSGGQLEQARALAAEKSFKIDFMQCDMARLDALSDYTFDLVISACAIAFVGDIDSTFGEIYRVLKPDGVFVLSDMHPFQYIIDETENGVVFNHRYPFAPILLKWRWEFDRDDKGKQFSAGFQHYVRSLSQYHNALVDAGFVVSKILEPEPTLDTPHYDFSREIWSEYQYIAEHLPITFIMICKRS
jgi:SAM-dependent methyltransferase